MVNKIKCIARKRFSFGGSVYEAGDSLEMNQKNFTLYYKMKYVKLADVKKEVAKEVTETENIEIEIKEVKKPKKKIEDEHTS
jgi:hypothetical protein